MTVVSQQARPETDLLAKQECLLDGVVMRRGGVQLCEPAEAREDGYRFSCGVCKPIE